MNLTDEFVIVADIGQPSLTIAPIETLEFKTLPLRGLVSPVAVDYDPISQMVYWTDVGSKSISRCYLNGTGQEIVLQLDDASGTYKDNVIWVCSYLAVFLSLL